MIGARRLLSACICVSPRHADRDRRPQARGIARGRCAGVHDKGHGPTTDVHELLESMVDAGLVVDAAGTILCVNDRAAQLLGYAPDELRGTPLEQLVPAGLRHSHAAQRTNYFQHPRARPMGVGISLSAARKDGTELPVEISLTPVNHGASTLVIASLRTIGAREEWYRTMFERLTVGVVHSDSAGRFLSVNDRFCKLIGYARSDALALDIRRLTHPDDLARTVQARARAVDGMLAEYQLDVRLIAHNGESIWTHIITAIVRHIDGGTPHFISLIQDISAQKQVEERSHESERRFREVTENIREVFWLSDREKRELLYVSPGFRELWGRDPEQLYQSPQLWLDAVHPEDRQRVIAAVHAKQAAGTYDEEYRIARPSGEIRWIRDRAFPIRGADDEVTRIAGVAEDITERKLAIDGLRESERRFREILGNVHLASVMLDENARITYCNDFMLQLSGWRREEVLARNWFELFIPAGKTQEIAGVFAAALADSPSAWHFESEILTRSGERRLLRWNNIVLRLPDGQVAGLAALGEDITERRQAEEMSARMAAIVESSDDAIIGKTLDGIITSWNAGARRLFGYAPEEALGRPIVMLLPPDRLAEEVEILERLRRGERIHHFETVRRRKDGSLVDVSLSISPILDARGQIVGASKIARDITERKRAEVKIRHLNRVYAVLSGINALIVRVRDREELFREACRIAVDAGEFALAWLGIIDPTGEQLRILAWHGVDDDYISRIPLELADPGSPGRGLAGVAVAEGKAIISNDIERDERFLLKSESLQRGIRSTVYIPLSIGGAVAGILGLYSRERDFFDEIEMRLLEELAGDIAFALDHIEKANRVDYLAYYDPLTGLANRSLLIERLNQQILTAQAADEAVALVLADVERFRTVNDSLGRQIGDSLLAQLAERLSRAAGSARSARVSGDVLAVMLPVSAGRVALEQGLTDLWREIFGTPFTVSGTEVRISARAGIALFPTDGANAETLLSCAESALRKAKETGEARVFHAPEMAARSAEKRTLETQLRRALENEEFVLHYQPKLELQSRRIVGAEALLRWQSPELGLVAPMRFIPLLEETGLILEVGAWALARAVLDHHRWMQRGINPPRIAVNVSAVQLRKADFVDTVVAALQEGALQPGIDLEITESLLLENVTATIRKLQELRERGIMIAIDDFGTGYSSLSYLARLPVHALKIDRSFILAMSDDPDTMTLVQTIISLAHSLNLRVIAEGVESEEQAKLLRLLRCDQIQGYLVSHPQPFEQMTALLDGTGSLGAMSNEVAPSSIPK